MDDFSEARKLLQEWKGDSYHFGSCVLDTIGETTKELGDTTIIVTNGSPWIREHLSTVESHLKKSRVSYSYALGSRPDTPLEDVYRIALQVAIRRPSSLLAVGSGSTIDAVKAASILVTYTPEDMRETLGVDWAEAGKIDPYFGTGLVTRVHEATGKSTVPVVAVQTCASSAAHLTKYSNITDPLEGQKKLIVDDAIVPRSAYFDYGVTLSAPAELTLDGGLDGIAHCWEVFMGASGKDYYGKLEHLVPLCTRLVVSQLPVAWNKPSAIQARTALGLGTDLGGYAIMIGGTNGPHLGSFSLVDILTHGRACGLLLPYYTVLFSSVIQEQLKVIAPIYHDAGYLREDPTYLEGRTLAEAVASAMLQLNICLGIPTSLRDGGVSQDHLRKMLAAARDPQLRMKLLNMPLPLDPEKGDVEAYMQGALQASFIGDLREVPVIGR